MLAEKETVIDEYLKNPFAGDVAEVSELTNYCKLLMPRSEEAKVEETQEESNTANQDGES